jgi:hypothetical protein
MKQRPIWLLALVFAICSTVHPVRAEEQDRPPNILWIVAENMGPDLGCYAARLVKTTRVDKLAAEGMRYEWAFDTCPVCSPSRSALMTGLHRYKYARFPIIKLMYDLQARGELTAIQQQLMAARLPKEELFDVENDPHEINNLVDSPDVDHRRVLKQLRRELTHWIEETNDQDVESESPAVIDHWVGDAARRHGTPDWYDEGFGASSN